MNKTIGKNDLENLFNKSYGQNPPTKDQWSKFYNKDVVFIDPTQQTKGLNYYVETQEKLIKR